MKKSFVVLSSVLTVFMCVMVLVGCSNKETYVMDTRKNITSIKVGYYKIIDGESSMQDLVEITDSSVITDMYNSYGTLKTRKATLPLINPIEHKGDIRFSITVNSSKKDTYTFTLNSYVSFSKTYYLFERKKNRQTLYLYEYEGDYTGGSVEGKAAYSYFSNLYDTYKN